MLHRLKYEVLSDEFRFDCVYQFVGVIELSLSQSHSEAATPETSALFFGVRKSQLQPKSLVLSQVVRAQYSIRLALGVPSVDSQRA